MTPHCDLKTAVCPRCQGAGKVVSAHVQACAACDGTGKVSLHYVNGYDEGKRIGRMLGVAEVTRAVEDVLGGWRS